MRTLMLTAASVLFLQGVAFAQRASTPPSSVTITVTGTQGQNGTYTLTTPVPYGNGPNDKHVTWSYNWMTVPGEPWRSPVIIGITIDHTNQITATTRGGQFGHVFTAVGDVYTIGSISAGPAQVQITANP